MNVAAILVTGPDAQKFLQGQLTCDLDYLTEAQSLRGAHCNQKGRVEALYDIFLKQSGDVLLISPEAVIQHALEKLQFYARFSKVTLCIIPMPENVQFKPTMPRLHPATIGKYLPQELGLDQQAHAVSFTKGCYLGQEIVARLHYLGQLKREPVVVPAVTDMQPGEKIKDDQYGEIEVLDVLDQSALVLVPVANKN